MSQKRKRKSPSPTTSDLINIEFNKTFIVAKNAHPINKQLVNQENPCQKVCCDKLPDSFYRQRWKLHLNWRGKQSNKKQAELEEEENFPVFLIENTAMLTSEPYRRFYPSQEFVSNSQEQIQYRFHECRCRLKSTKSGFHCLLRNPFPTYNPITGWVVSVTNQKCLKSQCDNARKFKDRANETPYAFECRNFRQIVLWEERHLLMFEKDKDGNQIVKIEHLGRIVICLNHFPLEDQIFFWKNGYMPGFSLLTTQDKCRELKPARKKFPNGFSLHQVAREALYECNMLPTPVEAPLRPLYPTDLSPATEPTAVLKTDKRSMGITVEDINSSITTNITLQEMYASDDDASISSVDNSQEMSDTALISSVDNSQEMSDTASISSNITLDNSQEIFMSSEELEEHYDYDGLNKLSNISEEPCVSATELQKLSDNLTVAKEIQVTTPPARKPIGLSDEEYEIWIENLAKKFAPKVIKPINTIDELGQQTYGCITWDPKKKQLVVYIVKHKQNTKAESLFIKSLETFFMTKCHFYCRYFQKVFLKPHTGKKFHPSLVAAYKANIVISAKKFNQISHPKVTSSDLIKFKENIKKNQVKRKLVFD